MASATWADLLALEGFSTVPGAIEQELRDTEATLGVRFPEDLRALYVVSDGVYDKGGEWWVIWPILQLADENQHGGANAWSLSGLLAFGDNGTGDPFCVSLEDPFRVVFWSLIDGEAYPLAPNLREFWLGWASGTLTT